MKSLEEIAVTDDEISGWSRLLDVLFLVVRMVFFLVILPLILVAGVLQLIGKVGDYLDEWISAAGHVMKSTLNPRQWAFTENVSKEYQNATRLNRLLQAEIKELREENNNLKGIPS